MVAERRLPAWFRVRAPGGENYIRVQRLMREHRLHTICEEAHCPNIGECWQHGTATFLILGDVCTRHCSFCAVKSGRPLGLDAFEPYRVAHSVKTLGLSYAVVTSVNRDDLPDGGAFIFAQTIQRIRQECPQCKVEVLTPDFQGDWQALETVVAARPYVLNHNIETVPRLYRRVRPKAVYDRSVELLYRARQVAPDMLTKSGMMVGLGESQEELLETMSDLREAGCDILTIGQYLRPSEKHLPIARFYTPEEFDELATEGKAMGFRHVEAGPLVRSSYHAHRHVEAAV